MGDLLPDPVQAVPLDGSLEARDSERTDSSKRKLRLKISIFSEAASVLFRAAVCQILPHSAQVSSGRDNVVETTARATDDSADFVGGDGSDIGSLFCTICSTGFLIDRDNGYGLFRQHYRTPWHRFNVGLRTKNKLPVSAEEFMSLHNNNSQKRSTKAALSDGDEDDLDETSSSSECESTDSSSEESSKQGGNVANVLGEVSFATSSGKMFSFSKYLLPKNDQLCSEGPQADDRSALNFVRTCLNDRCKIAMFMLSGGRFAGAVFAGTDVLLHKTFHRYTIRAKQGGMQSQYDSLQGGGNMPRSAGAALRRHNEVKLVADIRAVLIAWKERIAECHYVFLKCSKKKQNVFFECQTLHHEVVLTKTDTRLRHIPFTTFAPTHEEVRRIHTRLTSAYVFENVNDFEEFQKLLCDNRKGKPQSSKTALKPLASRLRQQKDNGTSSKENVNGKPVAVVAIKTKQFDSSLTLSTKRRSHSEDGSSSSRSAAVSKLQKSPQDELASRLYTAFKLGKLDEFETILWSTELTQSLLSHRFGVGGQTFLHLAAAEDKLAFVEKLLYLGADPTVRSTNKNAEVPFQCAKTKPTRKLFVEYRRLHPSRYDWSKAQVPVPLDAETEAAQSAKQAEKRRLQRQKEKEREKQRKEAERKLAAEEEERTKFLALSDREKRSLAAEKRFLQQCAANGQTTPAALKRCFNCAADITGKIPFEYSSNLFCSTKCVAAHRKARPS